jgi:hypothetical protein
MATADLLQREEEFYSSLFDSAKGNTFNSWMDGGWRCRFCPLGLDKCGNLFHWIFDFAVWTQAVA